MKFSIGENNKRNGSGIRFSWKILTLNGLRLIFVPFHMKLLKNVFKFYPRFCNYLSVWNFCVCYFFLYPSSRILYLDRFFFSNMKNVNRFITIMLNVILFQQKFNTSAFQPSRMNMEINIGKNSNENWLLIYLLAWGFLRVKHSSKF